MTTEGTRRLRVDYNQEDWAKDARKKAHAKARDPVRRAKIAASKRGKKRPAVMEKLRQANIGRRLPPEQRAKMSAAHRHRGTRPPKAGRAWTAEEDDAARTLPTAEAAKQTGRTENAVRRRRTRLTGMLSANGADVTGEVRARKIG